MRNFIQSTVVAALFTGSLAVYAEDKDGDIQPFGDLRFRQESIDVEGKKNRTRQRIRARLGLKSQLDDMTEMGIRLSTALGESTSGNETLDDNAAKKAVGIDLAYFTLKYSGAALGGGKVKNPFERVGGSQLIFDGDWNPEGMHLGYQYKADALSAGLVLGNFWLDERSQTKDDAMLQGAQLVVGTKFSIVSLDLGVASYQFTNLKDEEVLGSAANNSVEVVVDEDDDTYETYTFAYNLINYGLHVKIDMGIPLTLFYDAVTNQDPDEDNQGYWAGLAVGDGKFDKDGAKTPWKVEFIYMMVERDAVVGAITDSDSFGGGPDGEGYRLGASYALTKHMSAGVTYFDQTTPIDDGVKYNRGQIDLKFKM